jgi:hypothetical protein
MLLETGMPSTGETLYRRARKIMPGGTQLLSKRPEMFLPEIVLGAPLTVRSKMATVPPSDECHYNLSVFVEASNGTCRTCAIR